MTISYNTYTKIFLTLVSKRFNMVYKRKNPISVQDQKVLTAIGNKVYKLREATGLSLERFCSKNDIPRISYSNLEAGKNFHMTTLLKVLSIYKNIKSLNDFFKNL